MVITFDDIAVAGDISPNIVANGMKFALLTTVAALIGAIPLQFCYNYLIAKLDTIVLDMEDASISFVDLMVKHQK
jgi:biopolymer transport protein ExbB